MRAQNVRIKLEMDELYVSCKNQMSNDPVSNEQKSSNCNRNLVSK